MADQNGHILVVDDNSTSRLKLTMGLKQQGHTVALAENGQQALDMLRAEAFDVVLLDIILPEMDGHEVLRQMKCDKTLRDIPVIVISAQDDMDSMVKCIEMGAEDYLPKPFNPVLLKARLNASLRKKKLRDLEIAYLEQEVMLRQSEKLATLGRLSAGLAHELNNPAAATQRGVEQLRSAFFRLRQALFGISDLKLTNLQLASLLELKPIAQERAKQPDDLGALDRSDLEYEIETWLEDQGIDKAWENIPTLVSLGYGLDKLTSLTDTFETDQLPSILASVSSTYTICSLLEEMSQGAGRTVEIVNALKSYSYLDQAPIQSVDVRQGLDSTLVMFRSRLKAGVVVHREYAEDLPLVQAHGGELNQVWTNMIDNAIAAMDGHGELYLRTRQENGWVIVEIEDTGPGIPEEIQLRIFDPFFTTKPLGEGTGLGLNISHNIIVHKHKGQILIASQPGQTCFQIKLPINAD